MLEHFSNPPPLSHRRCRRRQHRHCFPFLWQEVFVDNLTLSFNLWETTCDHTGTWKCRAVYQYLGRTDDIDYWCRQQLTVSSEQHSPLPLSLQDSSTRVQPISFFLVFCSSFFWCCLCFSLIDLLLLLFFFQTSFSGFAFHFSISFLLLLFVFSVFNCYFFRFLFFFLKG